MAFQDTLEKRAEKMFQSVFGWEQKALVRIGKRVKSIGSLSYADLQAINNYAQYRGMSEKDFFKKYAADLAKIEADSVMEDLAKITGQNVRETKQIYADTINAQHEANKALYDYRNKPYVPLAENKELQALVDAYSRTTAETFVNFSMTKANAIGFMQGDTFVPLEKTFTDVLDKAVVSIATGTGTFGAEMRDVLRELGGSGVRVSYPSEVTRSLDSMVRQNLLWGAKQASREYSRLIGEELGCDGIEIDWHSNPRPSHVFMQGRQFVLGKSRTINGVFFESADKALKALDDYGCLHFETSIICGVSEPAYDSAELERLNQQNAQPITIDGVTKTGYEWKQTMRRLERAGRQAKLQREVLKASGDNIGADEAERTLKAIRKKEKRIMDKYQKIADRTGIKAQKEKMSFVKGKDVITPNSTASVKGTTPTPKKAVDITKKGNAKIETKPKQDILSFTPKQEEAIEWYVSGEGQWINQTLRGRSDIKISDLTDGEKELLENLTKATERPLADDVTKLYRSVDASAIFGDMSQTQFEQLQERLLYGEGTFGKGAYAEKIKAQTDSTLSSTKGKTITEKGFMSTSKEYDVISEWGDFTGADKPINLELDIPKGIQGADLRKFDVEGEEQFEVLLARNTEYEITEITAKDGYIYVKAKVLRQK